MTFRGPMPTMLFILLLAFPVGLQTAQSEILTEGWRFHHGVAPDAAKDPAYDDSSWREVRLPHDWAIEGPFDPGADGGSGVSPRDVAGRHSAVSRKIRPIRRSISHALR